MIPLHEGQMVTTFPKHEQSATSSDNADVAIPRESIAYYSAELADLEVPDGTLNHASVISLPFVKMAPKIAI